MATVDHLVYAVADLAAAIDRFERATGVRPAIGGAHIGLGTHNGLISFGGCYLELIAPDPRQPDPDGPRPFGIDDLDGPGLVGFAVRPTGAETIEDLIECARHSGDDPGPAIDMSRTTPDGVRLAWKLTMPSSTVQPFLIDWGDTPRPNTTAPGGVELLAFTAETPDTSSLASVYESLGLVVPVERADSPRLRATVSGPSGTLDL
jgi:hypothetical protein